jgi:hypothetical protein
MLNIYKLVFICSAVTMTEGGSTTITETEYDWDGLFKWFYGADSDTMYVLGCLEAYEAPVIDAASLAGWRVI